jgi:hypothetical protein
MWVHGQFFVVSRQLSGKRVLDSYLDIYTSLQDAAVMDLDELAELADRMLMMSGEEIISVDASARARRRATGMNMAGHT